MATETSGEENPLLMSPKPSTGAEDLDVTEEEEDEDEEGSGGPGAAKTPVSLLQELYVRRGITPKYDLVQIEGAVHEPTFKYRVTVGEFVATGCGQSKKKAKHCAAKSILDKLIGAQNSGQASPGQPAIPDLANEILSPYDDGIQGNPVGTLQEVCMNRRWPPPTYDLNNEEGLPHERSFTIICIISKFRETGSGKSKKLAKRQAANKMLAKLKDLPVENEEGFQTIDDDELAQGLAHRYTALKESNIKCLSSSHSQQVSKFHKNLKASRGEHLEKLQTTSLYDDGVIEFIEFLEEIGKEQNFEVTYVDIEEKSKKDEYHCLVQLSTLPVAVCYGSGEEVEKAQKAAAKNALEYLKIMTKK